LPTLPRDRPSKVTFLSRFRHFPRYFERFLSHPLARAHSPLHTHSHSRSYFLLSKPRAQLTSSKFFENFPVTNPRNSVFLSSSSFTNLPNYLWNWRMSHDVFPIRSSRHRLRCITLKHSATTHCIRLSFARVPIACTILVAIKRRHHPNSNRSSVLPHHKPPQLRIRLCRVCS